MKNYPLSKDYAELFRLVQTQDVICVRNNMLLRAVMYEDYDGNYISIQHPYRDDLDEAEVFSWFEAWECCNNCTGKYKMFEKSKLDKIAKRHVDMQDIRHSTEVSHD